jgi:threonylcarbamoyladenosine tRNA methylthiotransferase MtaB
MKVHLRTLGCRLNQSEIETMARQLVAQGHDVVDTPDLADQVIINTCAVTSDAAHSSRKLIRTIHRVNSTAEITVTGCYAQIAPDEITVLPGVGRVVGNRDKETLITQLTGNPAERFDQEPLQRDQPAWIGRTRAFIKVQDGCDNACTFCITTVARGEGRSRTIADVVAEIRMLHGMGYQEAVLTGVHLGSYGHDLGEANGLFYLVRAILADTDIPRLRLSSLEPWDLNDQFFTLWENSRVCPHLHLPLQSGCDSTLRRMARRTTQQQFRHLIEMARTAVHDPCITTDMIAGFPGETDAEFETSFAFVQEMDFAGLHVFRYSSRPHTPAARMRGQVAETTKKERVARLIALGEWAEAAYAQRHVGETLPVLWEQVAGANENGFLNVGYTHNYIRVTCIDPQPLANQVLPARLDVWDVQKKQMRVTPNGATLEPVAERREEQYGRP